MEFVTKTDELGNTIKCKRYQGRTFHKDTPGNVGDHLADIALFQCRPDDELLCTFPKSGTHWVFNMAGMLQTKTLDYRGTPEMLDFQDVEVFSNMKSPRMLHTHMTYPLIPKAAASGQTKIKYVSRNPKDVACSYCPFLCKVDTDEYEGSFDAYLQHFWSEECKYPVYSFVWNCSVKRPNHEITFLKKVENAVVIENMRKQHATPIGEREKWKHKGDKGRLPIYRKGIIGDWKNMFTVTQNERFDAIYKEKTSDMGVNLEFDYE